MILQNHTPFAAGVLTALDRSAREHLVLVLKAAYAISPAGILSRAEEQEPPLPAEVFYGEPGASSVKREAELTPPKPATDVVLLGSAVALRPHTRRMDVSLRVGPVAKTARVFGPRRWERGIGGASASEPDPFERMPLVYENAYGGRDLTPEDPKNHSQEPRNPVGRGFRGKGSRAEWAGALLPNLEHPGSPYTAPGEPVPPQGLGFIARDWQPRLAYAGTYDDAWLAHRMPLLPLDFDDRYHNCASDGLTVPGRLEGGEPVEILGCTPSGALRFSLPAPGLSARFALGREEIPLVLSLDTVLIDTDAGFLRLVWKASAPVHRRLAEVRTIQCNMEERPG